jgi:hypothetical protein
MFASWLQPATGCVTSYRNVWCVGTQSRFVSARNRSGFFAVGGQRFRHQYANQQYAEFDGWRWVSYWYPVRQVVSFKRDVYRRVMKEFASVVMSLQETRLSRKAHLPGDVKEVKPRKLCSPACEK